MGPRQVGKTTVVSQVIKEIDIPYRFLSADAIPAANNTWISNGWQSVRAEMQVNNYPEFLLIIDEIQKLSNWSEIVKKEWDYDSLNQINIKVILLGSSRLLLQQGLTESLAGRFELIRMGHWGYMEMHEAFGWDINQYIYFGGYPGAAHLIDNEQRWKDYVRDSLIETTISKDILMLTRIDKPALMRQLFELGCVYSGQIISLTKIMGQLQDAGNTTTLTNYLNMLNDCGLLSGLNKYASDTIRKRASIPKFQVYNNALMNAISSQNFGIVLQNPAEWGRLSESAVGSHLLNYASQQNFNLYYWREGNTEVDFILELNNQLIAIEVKTGHRVNKTGINSFTQKFRPRFAIIVGTEGIPLEDFLKMNPIELFRFK